MTDPIDKDALIRRLERGNEALVRRNKRLAKEIESLQLELLTKVSQHTDDARRKSWGGNGRY
jgi:hypothetical protein